MEYALITGASGGIGAAFAEALAKRARPMILVARSGDRLAELKARLEGEFGVIVHLLVLDLAEPDAPQNLYRTCRDSGWRISLLINNAGFGRIGKFLDFPLSDYHRMLALNSGCLMALCYLFAADMIAANGGGIINVASVAAFQPVPYFATYAATKAFVLSFSEALAAELGRENLKVLALCPGATRTEFFRAAKAPEFFLPKMQAPEEVAEAALDALEAGLPVYVPGWLNRITAAVPRLLPRRLLLAVSEFGLRRLLSRKVPRF